MKDLNLKEVDEDTEMNTSAGTDQAAEGTGTPEPEKSENTDGEKPAGEASKPADDSSGGSQPGEETGDNPPADAGDGS